MTFQDVVREDINRIIDSIKEEAGVLEGKTVLVSGGAGFLGNYIVGTLAALNKKVLGKPCHIVVVDNYITGAKDFPIENGEKIEFVEHDVREPLPSHIKGDFILHAAGIASPAYYQKFPLETIEVAVNGTKNFLEFAKRNSAKSVLYFSSSEIYGDPHPEAIPTPEKYWGNVSARGPRACYDESKRLGETLCTIYHQNYDVPVKTVRPFNVYGPGMKANDYRVVPAFMSNGLDGKPLRVHGQGNQTRTFCYISDATVAIFKVLLSGKNGEVYNIGNDEGEMSMVGLAHAVNKVLPKPVEVELIEYPDTYPAGEPNRRCPDLTKIRTELGYVPEVGMSDGLTRTILWYQHALKKESGGGKAPQ